MPIVRRHVDFEADYLAALDWLAGRGESTKIRLLAEGLDEVVSLLSSFPSAGAPAGRSDEVVLRKVVFRRGPYVAWYVHDAEDPGAEVWLVRLFHVRQHRAAHERRRQPPKKRKRRVTR